MKPVEVLRKAKALIEERGWCQGDFTNEAGCFCMLGACYAALGSTFNLRVELDDDDGSVVARFFEPSMDSFPSDVTRPLLAAVEAYYVHDWNDTRGRTKKEVLDAFDRAIALAEAAG